MMMFQRILSYCGSVLVVAFLSSKDMRRKLKKDGKCRVEMDNCRDFDCCCCCCCCSTTVVVVVVVARVDDDRAIIAKCHLMFPTDRRLGRDKKKAKEEAPQKEESPLDWFWKCSHNKNVLFLLMLLLLLLFSSGRLYQTKYSKRQGAYSEEGEMGGGWKGCCVCVCVCVIEGVVCCFRAVFCVLVVVVVVVVVGT